MAAGRTFRQPELAATLSRIAKGADREFYEGRTADLVVQEMSRGPTTGLISKSDLAGTSPMATPSPTTSPILGGTIATMWS